MSEMAERVARELEIAWVERTGHHPVGAMYETIKYLFPVMARVAIETMREPTDIMRREGWHELRKHNDIQTRLGNSLVGVETPTYQAMIDAALKSNAEVG